MASFGPMRKKMGCVASRAQSHHDDLAHASLYQMLAISFPQVKKSRLIGTLAQNPAALVKCLFHSPYHFVTHLVATWTNGRPDHGRYVVARAPQFVDHGLNGCFGHVLDCPPPASVCQPHRAPPGIIQQDWKAVSESHAEI
jgi:hypothetical protein